MKTLALVKEINTQNRMVSLSPVFSIHMYQPTKSCHHVSHMYDVPYVSYETNVFVYTHICPKKVTNDFVSSSHSMLIFASVATPAQGIACFVAS